MKIQAFCTNQQLANRQHLCAAMLENARDVYRHKGRIAPDKAASFMMAHNLHLVRLLEWGDVPKDKDPYTGSLRSFDKLSDYPLPVRQNLYRSVMRGIPMPTETKVSALRYALGLQDQAFDPCCFRRLGVESKTIRKMVLTCLPASVYKGKLLKRLGRKPKPNASLRVNRAGPSPQG